MKLIRWLLACVLLLCLQVTLHGSSESGSGVDFYRAVLDEKGNPRRLAVKRMPWDIINKKLGKVREVSYYQQRSCQQGFVPRESGRSG